MNSNQRRKVKRDLELNYTHSIKLDITNGLRYFEWDDRVTLMKMWCDLHIRRKWKCTTNYKTATFHFTEDQHAMFFALRWS
jgi:hypothetical protein